MWQVIFIASNKRQAEKIKKKLTEEGFLVKFQPMSSSEDDSYQLLVPEGEAPEVAELLSQAYDF